MSLLFLFTGGLSVYAYYNNDHEDVTKYMVVRDDSEDYDRLFDNANFKSFKIHFESDVFEEMLLNMQANFDLYGDYIDNAMYPVDITYTDSSDSFTVYSVGFRTRSQTSRNLPRTTDWRGRYVYHQTSFQLQFNETFDTLEQTNLYEILKTREVFNLEQLNFEYSQNYSGDYDTAMITEAYTHHLYQQAGLTVANASYGLVYLEIDEDLIPYGFFTFVEPVDSEFLKANFRSDLATDYGDLYKITDVQTQGTLDMNYSGFVGIDTDELRYTYSLRNNTLDGTRRTFDPLTDFIAAINDSDNAMDRLDQLLDVDLFVRYLAIGFLVGNTDDIRFNDNNYYLYFDVYNQQVSFVPFDLDSTLGFGKTFDLTGNYTTDWSIYHSLDDPNVLVDLVFSDQELRSLYETYLNDDIQTIFNYQDFYNDYVEAKDLYETILVQEGHLGNKIFDIRNMAWYFTTKTNTVLMELQ